MTTYFLNPSGGSDANSGLSSGAAFLTAAHSFNVMSGGDTLRILTGTISESNLIPPAGSSGAHTIISAFDSNPVTFTASNSFDFYNGVTYYIDITGNIIFDGTSHPTGFVSALALYQSHHITFDGSRIHDWSGVAIHVFSNGNIWRNCRNDHNGQTLDSLNQAGYGWYISQNASQNIIERCQIDNIGGYGVHCISYYGGMTPSSNSFRYNSFTDNGQTLSTNAASAILLSGVGNEAYRNLIVRGQRAGMDGYAVDVGHGAVNARVLSNTIVDNYGGIHIGDASNTQVKNNIVGDSFAVANIIDEGTATIFAKNLCFGTGGTAHAEFTFDPLFVAP